MKLFFLKNKQPGDCYGQQEKMVRTFITGAAKSENSKYEEAVKTLNTLQSNAQTLEKIRQDRDKNAPLNIPRMIQFASRAGIEMADMDKLNIIHVSGTKGKGSTCAYCESILRHHGYKTGFFSSPHLVEVRERFCVAGAPLEREKFATYFWEVYNRLESSKESHGGAMPNYFGFLTVMALHVFLQEQVDVAIMEVGIGGQYDSTNLVRHPVVCGVTSLGLDHTSILGHSVEKIAWHKAGIFKPGVPAFTVPQVPEAMVVLQRRAQEIGSPLSVCPDLGVYGDNVKLGIKGKVQVLNASLALQLCQTWMNRQKEGRSVQQPAELDENTLSDCNGDHVTEYTSCDIQTAQSIPLSPLYYKGLAECQWLGRNQTIRSPGLTYYLDGAHTVESIQQCVDWFCEESLLERKKQSSGVYRVLIFNTTGDREPSHLIRPLMQCKFDAVLFCPNIAYVQGLGADQTNNTVTKESQLKRMCINRDTYQSLAQETGVYHLRDLTDSSTSNGHGFDVLKQSGDCTDLSSRKGHASSEREKSGTFDKAYANGHENGVPFVNGCQEVDEADDSCTTANGHSENHKAGLKPLELHTMESIADCVEWICERKWEDNVQFEAFTMTTENGFEQSTKKRLKNNDMTSCITNGHSFNTQNDLSCGDNVVNGSLQNCKNGGDYQRGATHVQVLVTGSLHLVGGALRVIWDKKM